jgi:hypothetical protein
MRDARIVPYWFIIAHSAAFVKKLFHTFLAAISGSGRVTPLASNQPVGAYA